MFSFGDDVQGTEIINALRYRSFVPPLRSRMYCHLPQEVKMKDSGIAFVNDVSPFASHP